MRVADAPGPEHDSVRGEPGEKTCLGSVADRDRLIPGELGELPYNRLLPSAAERG